MKRSILIACVLLFLFSCQERNKRSDVQKTTSDTSYFDPNYEYIHLIPDSLRTKEQNDILDTLNSVVARNMGIKDGHLIFKMTKEEFVKKGIPVQYYDLILKDINANNNYLDTAKLQQSIDEILRDSFKEFK